MSYPDWSPDGQTIAVTHIYGNSGTIIQFQEGGISVIQQSATGWSPSPAEVVVVPHTVGKSRYTPNFVPDSSFLLYSEATRQTGDSDSLVDGYADPSRHGLGGPARKPMQRLCCWPARTQPGVADKLTLADGRSTLVVHADFQRHADGHLPAVSALSSHAERTQAVLVHVGLPAPGRSCDCTKPIPVSWATSRRSSCCGCLPSMPTR